MVIVVADRDIPEEGSEPTPVIYDGRASDLCKDDCDEGTCTPNYGDPYGCGCCCGCLGGCVRGYEEQMVEVQGRG